MNKSNAACPYDTNRHTRRELFGLFGQVRVQTAVDLDGAPLEFFVAACGREIGIENLGREPDELGPRVEITKIVLGR